MHIQSLLADANWLGSYGRCAIADSYLQRLPITVLIHSRDPRCCYN
jgi:hypothetical protein